MTTFIVTHPELGVARPLIVRAQSGDDARVAALNFHKQQLEDANWPKADEFEVQVLRLPAGGVIELFADGVIEPAAGPDAMEPQGQIWLVPANTGDPIVPDLLVVADDPAQALDKAQRRADQADLEIELAGDAHLLLPPAHMSEDPALSELPYTT